MTEVKVIHRGARISAQKACLVTDQIRGLSTGHTLGVPTFDPKRTAGIVKKVVESAIASAEYNESADISELRVESIYIDRVTSLKHFTACMKGRSNHTEKQTCHITVTLGN